MKKPRTIHELMEWVKEEQSQQNSIPYVLNGGGFDWIRPNDEFTENQDWENYEEEVEHIQKGEEFDDFKADLSNEVYETVEFLRIKHKTGYNEENHDIQIGYYE